MGVVSYRSGIADQLSLRFVSLPGVRGLRRAPASLRSQQPGLFHPPFRAVVSRQRAIELVQVVAGLPMVWYEL